MLKLTVIKWSEIWYFNLFNNLFILSNHSMPLPSPVTGEAWFIQKLWVSEWVWTIGLLRIKKSKDLCDFTYDSTIILFEEYLYLINRINQKHLPRTKMNNSIQRMLNFCALLPYTLLSFCFIFVVSIQFRSAGRWLLLLSKYYSWLC